MLLGVAAQGSQLNVSRFGDKIPSQVQNTVRNIQRQIERSKVSVKEFELALESLGVNPTRVEAVFPKMLRVDADNRMLKALLCSVRHRN